MLAALGWARARFRKGGVGQVPRLRAAARGTVRRAPGSTRLPLPETLVFALAMILAALGLEAGYGLDLALGVMLAHHLYL